MLKGEAISFAQSLLISGFGMALVLLELGLLALLVLLLPRFFAKKAQHGTAASSVPSAPSAPPAPSPAAPAEVELINAPEPLAAMAMAVVADQCGIPIERLRFVSVRGLVELHGVDEATAEAVMRQTALELGRPLADLHFTAIRRLPD